MVENEIVPLTLQADFFMSKNGNFLQWERAVGWNMKEKRWEQRRAQTPRNLTTAIPSGIISSTAWSFPPVIRVREIFGG